MKRSQVLRKLTYLLKSWEGSKLDGETSKLILDMLQYDVGMLPPSFIECPLIEGGRARLYCWDDENVK